MIINQYLFVEAGVGLFLSQPIFTGRISLISIRVLMIERNQHRFLCIRKIEISSKKYFRGFCNDTRCIGIEGGSGRQMRNSLTDTLNCLIRKVNYIFDKHYIWLSF